MMRPRLDLAKSLLRHDGLIVISVDDSEIAHLRLLMDDIYGSHCFVSELVWKNKYNAGALTRGFSSVHEYILVYSKSPVESLTAPLEQDDIDKYTGSDSNFSTRGGFVTQPLATSSKDARPNLRYPILINGEEIWPEKQWIWEKSRTEAAIRNGEVVVNERDGKKSVRVKQYLRNEDGTIREKKPLSLLIGPFNQEGTREADAIFGKGVFSFPKPCKLIRWLLSLTVNESKSEGDIILDFFAGSGTTGQAVMQQNAADGRSRRFVLVQLPEPLSANRNEQRAAYSFCTKKGLRPSIAELTKERLKKSASELSDESPLFGADTGFRTYKLDDSCFNAWASSAIAAREELLQATDRIKPDRSVDDLLCELLLRRGLDLCTPIESREVTGKTVHAVGGGVLLACLAEKITREEGEPLAQGIVDWHQELDPIGDTVVVFRDDAFADDVVKTNVAAILEQNGLTNVKSL